jgi:hypothetical protein
MATDRVFDKTTDRREYSEAYAITQAAMRYPIITTDGSVPNTMIRKEAIIGFRRAAPELSKATMLLFLEAIKAESLILYQPVTAPTRSASKNKNIQFCTFSINKKIESPRLKNKTIIMRNLESLFNVKKKAEISFLVCDMDQKRMIPWLTGPKRFVPIRATIVFAKATLPN